MGQVAICPLCNVPTVGKFYHVCIPKPTKAIDGADKVEK